MKKIILLFAVLLSLIAEGAEAVQSAKISIGQPLPEVTLSGHAGELRRSNGKIIYRDWSTDSLKGRAYMLYIVAARWGADKINQPLLDALAAEGGAAAFPGDKVKVVSVLNIDDVFPLGRGIARAAFEDAFEQPENQHAIFVLDNKSLIQQRWGLTRQSAAVVIVDDTGKVLRFKDGALNESEVQDYVEQLKTLRDE